MNLFRKISVWFLPLIVLIIIFGLFTLKQLNNLETPPSKNWSRSIPLPMKDMTDSAKLFTQKRGSNTAIYAVTKKGISEVEVSPSMDILTNHTYPVHPDNDGIWAKGSTLIYIKNGKLTEYTKGHTKILDSHAAQLMPADNDHIIYSSGPIVKEADPATGRY